jgi:glycosyltransferase involved in cell wall biosynthesis
VSGSVEVETLALNRLVDARRRLAARRYSQLAISGSPPDHEVGYGLTAAIALVSRPARVLTVDLELGRIRTMSLRRYLAAAVPFGCLQVLAGAAAVGVQGLLTSVVAPARPLSGTWSSRNRKLRRVLYLRPSSGVSSPVGGSVTHAHEVIRAMTAQGVEVDAFTSDAAIAMTALRAPNPPCRWRVVEVSRALKALPATAALGSDLALIRAALPIARRSDMIYQRHARFSLVGALLSRLTGVPLFLEYNGSQQFVGRYWNPTPLKHQLAQCEEAALRTAARILVVSEVDRKNLVARGIEPERVILNPNGVAVEQFANGGGSEVRRKFGFADDDFVIGFVGSFGPWHGAPVLARAFCLVVDGVPHARLVLVGEGHELEATRQILAEAGVEKRVVYAGQVPPSEIPTYLDACDVLASPHVPLPDGVEFFGSPTKLFEYMASGRAIVASCLGQIADVLEHGRTGWLVPPGDVHALALGLKRLADAPDLRRELGGRARRTAQEFHTWRRNAECVIDAFDCLVGESS